MAEAKKPAKATTKKKTTTAKKPVEKVSKPRVKKEIQEKPAEASRIAPDAPVIPKLHTVKVKSFLNVRAGAGKEYKAIRQIEDGAVVSVYEEKDGFGRISKDQDEWVMMSFLK